MPLYLPEDNPKITPEKRAARRALNELSSRAKSILERAENGAETISDKTLRGYARLLLLAGPELDEIPDRADLSPLYLLVRQALRGGARDRYRATKLLAEIGREPAAASANVQVNIGQASPFDALSTESLAALTRVLAAQQVAGTLPAPPISRQMAASAPESHLNGNQVVIDEISLHKSSE